MAMLGSTTKVAPRAGAWVEIISVLFVSDAVIVAPRAGAWVEISPIMARVGPVTSLLVQERGLK